MMGYYAPRNTYTLFHRASGNKLLFRQLYPGRRSREERRELRDAFLYYFSHAATNFDLNNGEYFTSDYRKNGLFEFSFQYNYQHYILVSDVPLWRDYWGNTTYPRVFESIQNLFWKPDKDFDWDYALFDRIAVDFFAEEVFRTQNSVYLHVVSPEVVLSRDFSRFPPSTLDNAIWKYYMGKGCRPIDKADDIQKARFISNYINRYTSRIQERSFFYLDGTRLRTGINKKEHFITSSLLRHYGQIYS